MDIHELEELVSAIRQFISTARTRNDTFEYCRLCDELKMAQAALAAACCNQDKSFPRKAVNNPPLAMV